jgi:hypothetical protein
MVLDNKALLALLSLSESLWMGGMPMIWGQRDNPNTSNINEDSCIVNPVNQPSLEWRYCFEPPSSGFASNPFDTHEDLYDYWATGNTSNVLGLSNRGAQILMPGASGGPIVSENTQFIWGGAGGNENALNHDLRTVLEGGLDQINDGLVGNATALSNRVQQLLTSPQGLTNPPLRMGDYIFINTNPTHGLLVVGWQTAQNCEIALRGTGNPLRHWQITDFAMSYADAQGILNPVPYVADFTSPFVNNPTPRPFYCTRFVDDIGNPTAGQPSFFDAHDWYLFTMPDNVTVPVNNLYIDEQWSW